MLNHRSPKFLLTLGIVAGLPALSCWLIGLNWPAAVLMCLAIGPVLEEANWEATSRFASLYFDQDPTEFAPAYDARRGLIASAAVSASALAAAGLDDRWRIAIANSLLAMLLLVGALLTYFVASHLFHWRAIRRVMAAGRVA